jgi:hypothetical protein
MATFNSIHREILEKFLVLGLSCRIPPELVEVVFSMADLPVLKEHLVRREKLLERAEQMEKHAFSATYQPVYSPMSGSIIEYNINLDYVQVIAQNPIEALVKFFDLMNEHCIRGIRGISYTCGIREKAIDWFSTYSCEIEYDYYWKMWNIEQPTSPRSKYVGRYQLEHHTSCDPKDCSDCNSKQNLPKAFKFSPGLYYKHSALIERGIPI